jgi:hypothetical protein
VTNQNARDVSVAVGLGNGISDLVASSEMLFQSSDRIVLLEVPTGDYQAGRQHNRASDEVDVHIPLGVGSRFINKEGPAQRENRRKKFAQIAVFSHDYSNFSA